MVATRKRPLVQSQYRPPGQGPDGSYFDSIRSTRAESLLRPWASSPTASESAAPYAARSQGDLAKHRLGGHVTLCLQPGIRTEEARGAPPAPEEEQAGGGSRLRWSCDHLRLSVRRHHRLRGAGVVVAVAAMRALGAPGAARAARVLRSTTPGCRIRSWPGPGRRAHRRNPGRGSASSAPKSRMPGRPRIP